MGRQPCCDKIGLKKGPWTADEDRKLVTYIAAHGHGCWREVPKLAGLLRCGKSCRLRWTNYLRPDLKRGMLSEAEEDLIIRLHAAIGNRWSRIAAQLPGRTDNEIKNYWNTRIKKKLKQLGIDPVTHRPLAAAPPAAYHLRTESSLGVWSQGQTATAKSERAEHSTNELFTAVKIKPDAETYVGWSPSLPLIEPKQRDGVSTETHVLNSLLLQNLKPTTSAESPNSGICSPSSMSSLSRKTRSDEDSDDSVCTGEFVESTPDSRPQRVLPCYKQTNSSAIPFDGNSAAFFPPGGSSGDLKPMTIENSICLQTLSREIAHPWPSAFDDSKRGLLPPPEICPISSNPLSSLSSLTVEASATGPFNSHLIEFSPPQPSADLCTTAEYPTQWNELADGWNVLDYQLMNSLYESANPAAVMAHSATPGSWTAQLLDSFLQA